MDKLAVRSIEVVHANTSRAAAPAVTVTERRAAFTEHGRAKTKDIGAGGAWKVEPN
jgi:hypothetical protein